MRRPNMVVVHLSEGHELRTELFMLRGCQARGTGRYGR